MRKPCGFNVKKKKKIIIVIVIVYWCTGLVCVLVLLFFLFNPFPGCKVSAGLLVPEDVYHLLIIIMKLSRIEDETALPSTKKHLGFSC